MSTRRLSQNQFIGLKRDLPLTFKEGATYLTVDTKQLYMYDENEQPVLLTGTGEEVTIVDLYGGNAVIRGGVVWEEDLTFYVWASEYIVDGVYYDDPVAGSVTLEDADGSNPRIDVFAITNDGVNAPTVAVVEGDASASPLKPTVELGTQVEVSFVQINAGATEPITVTKEMIYNENLGNPDEWVLTTNSKIDPSKTDAFYKGSVGLGQSGDVAFEYTSSDLISINGTASLIFAIRVDKLSTSSRSASLSFKFRNSSTNAVSQPVTINNVVANKYNINLNKLDGWQLGSIPMSEFKDLPGDFDVIEFNSFGILSMRWDWMHLQGGLSTSGGTTISEGIQSVVAGAGIVVDNTDPKNPVVSSTSGSVTPPSGLEAINEGNGVGFRLIGRNESNYGNIGLDSIDFGTSSGTSSVTGARGPRNFVGPGTDNNIQGDTNTAFGAQNTVNPGTYSSANFIIGYDNLIEPWSFASLTSGWYNKTGTAGSTGGSNGVAWYGMNSGYFNEMYGSRGTHLFGSGLVGGSAFTTIVGAANVDLTNTTASQFWAESNDSENPAFIVGIGDVNSADNTSPVFSRSNGWVTWRNGTSEQPEATISGIDSRGAKAVPTVEWINDKIAQVETTIMSPIELNTSSVAPIDITPAASAGKCIAVDYVMVSKASNAGTTWDFNGEDGEIVYSTDLGDDLITLSGMDGDYGSTSQVVKVYYPEGDNAIQPEDKLQFRLTGSPTTIGAESLRIKVVYRILDTL